MAITSNATAIVFNDATVQTTAFTGAGAAVIPTGSVMLFFQAAAPTGWTQVTTQNNKALRVVSGTGGNTGGSVTFTTAFASQAVSGTVGTSGATTLSTSQIPAHSHNAYRNDESSAIFTPALTLAGNNTTVQNLVTLETGGGGSHTHAGGSFSGTAINLAVQYIDIIICSKN
jgi:hypothetical protein